MTIRTETFSYLPPFTEAEVRKQVEYILKNRWIPIIEYTDRPGPDVHYWRLWKLPLFGAQNPDEVLAELAACRDANPNCYVRLIGYDPGPQLPRLSLVVYRPMDRG